jgi:hypothetical protein
MNHTGDALTLLVFGLELMSHSVPVGHTVESTTTAVFMSAIVARLDTRPSIHNGLSSTLFT